MAFDSEKRVLHTFTNKPKRPKISILTATLPNPDRCHLLKETWDSIKSQTEEDWEWLIQVDGKEPLDEKSIPQDMKKDPRVVIEETNNRFGLFVARNRLALRANSSIIVFVDDDDLLPEKALEFWINTLLEEPKVDWATGGLVVFDENGFDESFVPQIKEGVVSPGASLKAWERDEDVFPIVLNSTAMRRDAFFHSGGAPAMRQCGDLALILRISCLFAGYASYEPVVYYRSHEHQWTKSEDWWKIELPERAWVRQSVQILEQFKFPYGR